MPCLSFQCFPGYPHLSKLIDSTKFPWLLSNIVDTTTSEVPKGLREFQILERAGIRLGIIGLVEKSVNELFLPELY
jgi:2',3'-cyclic-nucleotide 2'-phosphodiesterase (5'-nucleotidase family)